MKKVYLFDLDGTLVDSIPTVVESFRYAFEAYEVEYPGDDAIEALIGSNVEQIIAKFAPKEKVKDIAECRNAHYLDCQNRGQIKLFDSVHEGLQKLNDEDCRLGVITTKRRDFTDLLLEQLRILPLFETVIGGDDVDQCKPHPEPLLKGAAMLQENIDQCCYVGDSVHDAAAAANAGMEFIGIATGTAQKTDLEKYGTIHDSFAQFVTEQNKN
jgi:pyrophosphatase PpaX